MPSQAYDPTDDINALQEIRSSLIQTYRKEVAYELVNGARPSYSLFGESYNFPEWCLKVNEQIVKITENINRLSAPWEVQSGGGVWGCW